MQVTASKLSPVLIELQVEVPAAEVRSEVDKEYLSVQKRARVRGFRPGKAPRHVLAHLYAGSIHADVARRLADRTLSQAIASKQVEPLSQPALALGDLSPEVAFSYKARFEVRPEIESVKWEGFALTRPKAEATDAMIDAEIEKLRLEHSTLQAPDPERPAKAGDVLHIAFTLLVDGAERPEGTQELDTELGDGKLLKELDAGLTGMKLEEKKTIDVPFPEAHPNPAFAGKTGQFEVTVKELKERILPSVDDEFAKDCEAESLAALRDSLKAKIEAGLKQASEDQLAQQIVVELCKANPIPVPPSLVDQQARATEQEILASARRQGMRGGLTQEIKQRARLDAEVKVRAGLLMGEIAKVKQLQITNEDIEKGYEELAAQTGKNVAKVKAEYRDPKKREMLIGMILEDRILTLIEEAATVTETAAEAAS